MPTLQSKFTTMVKQSKSVHTVVMVRHGESIWNSEKRFTGWCNIPLTQHGEADARDAGALMGERGLKFDVAFTSTLERAWRTCAMILSTSGQSDVETIKSWRLNERHYGALQGHLKSSEKLIQAFGENKIIEWRRSYKTAPPSLIDKDFISSIGEEEFFRNLSEMDPSYLDYPMTSMLAQYLKLKQIRNHGLSSLHSSTLDDKNYSESDYNPYLLPSNMHPEYPLTESLKQCEQRAFGYWNRVIAPQVKEGKRVLIVAHANTIRGLVKAMDNISDEQIAHLKIPNGIPLVYTLDENLQPVLDLTDDLGFQANYLVSARNHGKMMAYERCVQKKLRSLFEYLDTDGDGRITSQCLQQGLNKLNSLNLRDTPSTTTSSSDSSSSSGSNGSSGSIAPSSSSLSTIDTTQQNMSQSINNTQFIPMTQDAQSTNDNNNNNHHILKAKEVPIICEYEVEELLRCIPNADEDGGVTLQSFLESEETLLPTLSQLRLLQ